MSEFTEPAVGHREDAPTYQFLDNLAHIVVSGDETDGRRSVVEMHQPAGHRSPTHIHEETDETLHVLEGALTAHVKDSAHQVTAGGTVVLPQGEPHAVVADEPSVVLVSNTPAGFDEFVAAAGEPTDRERVPSPPPSDDAIQRVREAAPEHGIELVGPPPGDQ